MSQNVPNPKQQKAIDALLAGQTREKAAQSAGVDRRTVTRWLNDSGFQEALAQSRFAIGQETLNQLVELGSDAIAVLRQTLQGENVPVSRSRVAIEVVRLSIERIESAHVQKQIDELRKRLDANK